MYFISQRVEILPWISNSRETFNIFLWNLQNIKKKRKEKKWSHLKINAGDCIFYCKTRNFDVAFFCILRTLEVSRDKRKISIHFCINGNAIASKRIFSLLFIWTRRSLGLVETYVYIYFNNINMHACCPK